MSNFVVDVEADGPYPGDFSMVSFGIMRVDEELKTGFFKEVKPISENFEEERLKVIGVTRKEHEKYKEPVDVMCEARVWIEDKNVDRRPIFWSDNPCFDWMFFCWYIEKYTTGNPFGFSGRRIGDLYCGLKKDLRARWKKLRKTKHTHHPLVDAKGNAEALLEIFKMMKE